jgi:hypothetical protein
MLPFSSLEEELGESEKLCVFTSGQNKLFAIIPMGLLMLLSKPLCIVSFVIQNILGGEPR